MKVVGVDGCPEGWLAIVYDITEGTLNPVLYPTFRDVLTAYGAAAGIGVDIPIGLVEGTPRECDLEARRVLGRPRQSSVFPAPDPRLINSPSYEEALASSRSLTGKGISRQAFGIYTKIAEVNEAMTSELQDRVIEVHPEVSFWALAGGRPMAHPKSIVEGFEERRALLKTALNGLEIPSRQEAQRMARPAAADDVLDAIVAAWTARRHAEQRAGRLPADPPVSKGGLRMEIVY